MRDLNVDRIKKLWVLDLIIRGGSLRKAAISAGISPSAVSQSLSSLEKSVGRPLLVRNRGSISPTSEALAMLAVIRPAFEAFDKLRELNHAPAPRMSWLNFGTYESLAIDVLPGLILSLRERMPRLRLGVRIARTPELLSMVRRGELCSALITEVDDLDRFYVKEVSEDRLGLFVSRRHPIGQLGWKAIEEYGYGSLTPSAKDGLPRYYEKYLQQLEGMRPIVRSDSFESLSAAAAAGALVAVLPKRVAMRNDDLVELSPPKTRAFKEQGKHRICVVSQTDCDPEETHFLATQARSLLK